MLTTGCKAVHRKRQRPLSDLNSRGRGAVIRECGNVGIRILRGMTSIVKPCYTCLIPYGPPPDTEIMLVSGAAQVGFLVKQEADY